MPKPNEWELNDGVGHIEGTVRKSNGHFWRQMQEPLEVFNHGCKKGVNKIKQRIVPIKLKSTWVLCNTLSRNIGPHRSNNNCQGCSDVVPKRIGKEPRRSRKPPEYKPCRIPMVAEEA